MKSATIYIIIHSNQLQTSKFARIQLQCTTSGKDLKGFYVISDKWLPSVLLDVSYH